MYLSSNGIPIGMIVVLLAVLSIWFNKKRTSNQNSNGEGDFNPKDRLGNDSVDMNGSVNGSLVNDNNRSSVGAWVNQNQNITNINGNLDALVKQNSVRTTLERIINKKEIRWIAFNPKQNKNFFLLTVLNRTERSLISILMDITLSYKQVKYLSQKGEIEGIFLQKSHFYLIERVISDKKNAKEIILESYVDVLGICQKLTLYALKPELWQDSADPKMKSYDHEVFHFLCLKAHEAEMFRVILEKMLGDDDQDFVLEKSHKILFETIRMEVKKKKISLFSDVEKNLLGVKVEIWTNGEISCPRNVLYKTFIALNNIVTGFLESTSFFWTNEKASEEDSMESLMAILFFIFQQMEKIEQNNIYIKLVGSERNSLIKTRIRLIIRFLEDSIIYEEFGLENLKKSKIDWEGIWTNQIERRQNKNDQEIFLEILKAFDLFFLVLMLIQRIEKIQ